MRIFRFVSVCLLTLMLSLALQSFTVVIDAGHGGHDPGAIGSVAKEKDLNLSVSLLLGKMIEDSMPDVKLYLTRKTDVFLTLQERANFVNKHNADLFICVHTNSAENKKVTGAETFTLGMDKMASNLDVAMRENAVMMLEDDYKTTYQGFDPNSVESYIMFEFMQDQYMDKSLQFASQVQQQFVAAGRADRGVRQAGFWVLHKSACPSVLVEMGFITNKEEEQFLASDAGKKKIAGSIFEAFRQYKAAIDKRQSEAVAAKQTAEKENDKSASAATAKPATKQVDTKNQKLKDRVEKPQKAVDKPLNPAADKQSNKKKTDAAVPVYKVQIFAVRQELKAGDATFKGVKNAEFTKVGDFYKYTVGSETDYNEILKLQQEMKAKFADCFIVAFVDGKQVPLKQVGH